MNGYIFFIETYSGERTEWAYLSKQVAQAMLAATDRALPANVREYGWDDCTEGYREPIQHFVIDKQHVNAGRSAGETLGGRYEIYVACVGKDNAKTFDEWLNT
jgi:hypothetical protein